MRNAPKETVDAWLRTPALDPVRLVPGLLIGPARKDPLAPNHAIRFLTAAVAKGKREPRSDRRLAGMRDSAVRIFGFCARRRDADDVCGVQQASKAIKLRDLGQRRPNMLAKAGESDRAIKVKMV